MTFSESLKASVSLEEPPSHSLSLTRAVFFP